MVIASVEQVQFRNSRLPKEDEKKYIMNTYLAVRASLNCFRTFILTGSGPACGDVSNLLPPSDPVKKGKGIFLIQENT